MIYTVTFNPSLDYVVQVPDFQLGRTNRTAAEHLFPGGKGINVSIVLKRLGQPTTALGFLAGVIGEEILRRLADFGVCGDFIALPGACSRINVKLQSHEGTEINGMGPVIPQPQTQALLQKLDGLRPGDVLVLAGSIPASMGAETYGEILHRVENRGVLTVVDASGELLKQALVHRPFLIKPNHRELGELFGLEVNTRKAAVPCARKLQDMGARNVLVSMAGQGAVLVTEAGQVIQARAPKGRLVNGVGAGDAMVAGFLTGWLETGDYAHAFRLSVAAGSASVFSQHLPTRESILELYRQMS